MPMTKPSVLTRRAVRLACTGVVLAALSAIPAMLPFGSGAHAQNARTPYTLIESGRSFAALQEAVNAIGDGTGTIRIAPGVYRDCAVAGSSARPSPVSRRATWALSRKCRGKRCSMARPAKARRRLSRAVELRGSKGLSSRTSACPMPTGRASGWNMAT